jgi:hypothetical protein
MPPHPFNVVGKAQGHELYQKSFFYHVTHNVPIHFIFYQIDFYQC